MMAEDILLQQYQHTQLIARYWQLVAQFEGALGGAQGLLAELKSLRVQLAADPLMDAASLAGVDTMISQVQTAFSAAGV